MDLPHGRSPAWLPDPLDAARVRWWNGTSWSDNVRLATPDLGVAHSANSAAYSVPAASVARASRIRLTGSLADAANLGTAEILKPGFNSRRARREAERATAIPQSQRRKPTAPPSPSPSLFEIPVPMYERGEQRVVPMRRAYSPHNAWAWTLVLSPIWLVGLLIVPRWFDAVVLPGAVPDYAIAALVVLAVFVVAAAAYCDVQRLKRAGFPRPAHWFWTLLGPLGYLVARSVRSHGATGRGWVLVRAHLYVFVLVAAFLVVQFITGSA